MREIKFRAWDVIDKEMFRVVLLSAPQGKDYLIVSGRGGSTTTEKEQCVLMQFTGLKDKNGKEIYEGDIVKFEAHRDGKEYYHATASVDFDLGQFHIHGTTLRDYTNIEIIGNIYENPDLLSNPKDNG